MPPVTNTTARATTQAGHLHPVQSTLQNPPRITPDPEGNHSNPFLLPKKNSLMETPMPNRLPAVISRKQKFSSQNHNLLQEGNFPAPPPAPEKVSPRFFQKAESLFPLGTAHCPILIFVLTFASAAPWGSPALVPHLPLHQMLYITTCFLSFLLHISSSLYIRKFQHTGGYHLNLFLKCNFF